MRKDARAHRAALIRAAACIFARHGFDVPLETVLAEAGVGRGTLYRHFANRKALIVAVLELELDRLDQYVDAHVDSPGLLVDFIRRQGLLTISLAPFMMRMPQHEALAMVAPLEAQISALFDRVVALARCHGIVDASFAGHDLRLVNLMLLAARDEDPAREAELFDRAMAIVLRGIGVEHRHSPAGRCPACPHEPAAGTAWQLVKAP